MFGNIPKSKEKSIWQSKKQVIQYPCFTFKNKNMKAKPLLDFVYVQDCIWSYLANSVNSEFVANAMNVEYSDSFNFELDFLRRECDEIDDIDKCDEKILDFIKTH